MNKENKLIDILTNIPANFDFDLSGEYSDFFAEMLGMMPESLEKPEKPKNDNDSYLDRIGYDENTLI